MMKVLAHPIKLPGEELAPSETGRGRWTYAVPFRNDAGEVVVLVALSEDERLDAAGTRAPLGGPAGAVARGYALRRAYQTAPGGFELNINNVSDIAFVTVH